MKKQAILLIHFGTTHDDTREKTIDAFRKKVELSFADCDVFEAFTSRMIIKRLKARGIVKQNPLELLQELKEKGYTHIYVQTSHILHGIEYENLKEELDSYKKEFEEIKMGEPLLSSVEDYKQVVSALGKRQKTVENQVVVYIGHGTEHAANASYSMMRYVFFQEGYSPFFMGTVEGYPEFPEVLKEIQAQYPLEKPKVILKPFMFVAGEHAKNDIAVDWKKAFEEAGFVVSDVVLEGLGEIPEIQDIFMKHLQEAIENKRESIAEYKKKLS